MPANPFTEAFAQVEEPRIHRSKLHELTDILFLCVAATLAGCDGPTEIADFSKQKLKWFRRFIPLKNGVPSHDTIGRVVSLINPLQFQRAFLDWVTAIVDLSAGGEGPRLVPIDGKTLRGSRGARHRENPLHLVSAWATQQGLALGQVAVEDKSNEITAIPKVLEMIELSGAIVSIDAMGCQKEIAKKIVEGGGDYVLAVKDNQPALSDAVESFFLERHEEDDFSKHRCVRHSTKERSRGREEERHYAVAPVPKSMKKFRAQWKGLQSIGQVVTLTERNGEQISDVRYYISSRPAKAKEFSSSVRQHWSIESMHWVLDVIFAEDVSRIRNGHAAENFAALRKFVISILKQDTSAGSLKGKRKRAGWNTDFLEKLLFG